MESSNITLWLYPLCFFEGSSNSLLTYILTHLKTSSHNTQQVELTIKELSEATGLSIQSVRTAIKTLKGLPEIFEITTSKKGHRIVFKDISKFIKSYEK